MLCNFGATAAQKIDTLETQKMQGPYNGSAKKTSVVGFFSSVVGFWLHSKNVRKGRSSSAIKQPYFTTGQFSFTFLLIFPAGGWNFMATNFSIANPKPKYSPAPKKRKRGRPKKKTPQKQKTSLPKKSSN